MITNHLSGDRVTVGLAHWDGSALRFACAVASLRDHTGFVHIERAVRTIERRITQRSDELRSATSGALADPTLAELAPGSELIGDALVWSEGRRGITGDSAAHFTELGSKLGLLRRSASNEPRRPLNDCANAALTPELLRQAAQQAHYAAWSRETKLGPIEQALA